MHVPRFACTVLLLLCSCRTWHGDSPNEHGLTARDIACARTFYVGEPPHPGMPLLPMEPDQIRRVTAHLRRGIPDLREVKSVSAADLVISVIFVPALPICTHCDPKPDTEWSAIIEKGGPSHQAGYSGIGPFIGLNGHVVVGTNVVGAFVRQLAELHRNAPCGG